MADNGIHLIMPMAGAGSRFYKQGYQIPKPLISIKGEPFFYWATQSIKKFTIVRSLTFVVLQEHIDKFNIDRAIMTYFPGANITILDQVLNGAVLTCLEGVKEIKDDAPIVFNDCDHIFRCESFYSFCNSENYEMIDGALLSFESNDPKFSYLDYDQNGNVVRTVEKQVISNEAICGAYYFRNRSVFEKSAIQYLEVCDYKEYFMSGVYNIIASNGRIIKSFRVDNHLPFGTPEEYEKAKDSDCFGELD